MGQRILRQLLEQDAGLDVYKRQAHRLKGAPLHPTVTLEQNVQVLALLDAAMISAKSGREEAVERDLP